jgi:hypothetical protein
MAEIDYDTVITEEDINEPEDLACDGAGPEEE